MNVWCNVVIKYRSKLRFITCKIVVQDMSYLFESSKTIIHYFSVRRKIPFKLQLPSFMRCSQSFSSTMWSVTAGTFWSSFYKKRPGGRAVQLSRKIPGRYDNRETDSPTDWCVLNPNKRWLMVPRWCTGLRVSTYDKRARWDSWVNKPSSGGHGKAGRTLICSRDDCLRREDL